jgi:hypothetical protein
MDSNAAMLPESHRERPVPPAETMPEGVERRIRSHDAVRFVAPRFSVATNSRARFRKKIRGVAGMVALLLACRAAARDSLGVFESWGAFTDASPARCFAIAQPVQSGGSSRWRPFASIATWPSQGARNQLHIRLSRERDPRAHVTLSVGERRFELVAGKADAWAPDARTDAAVVAAIRSGRSMSVETVARTGGPFADTYALRGAATAIDAASLGCVKR